MRIESSVLLQSVVPVGLGCGVDDTEGIATVVIFSLLGVLCGYPIRSLILFGCGRGVGEEYSSI